MRAASRLLACLTVAGVIVGAFAPLASADIPKIISYQGKVTDTGGSPRRLIAMVSPRDGWQRHSRGC